MFNLSFNLCALMSIFKQPETHWVGFRDEKWDKCFRESFYPNSEWGSLETTTIGKTHPTVFKFINLILNSKCVSSFAFFRKKRPLPSLINIFYFCVAIYNFSPNKNQSTLKSWRSWIGCPWIMWVMIHTIMMPFRGSDENNETCQFRRYLWLKYP